MTWILMESEIYLYPRWQDRSKAAINNTEELLNRWDIYSRSWPRVRSIHETCSTQTTPPWWLSHHFSQIQSTTLSNLKLDQLVCNHPSPVFHRERIWPHPQVITQVRKGCSFFRCCWLMMSRRTVVICNRWDQSRRRRMLIWLTSTIAHLITLVTIVMDNHRWKWEGGRARSWPMLTDPKAGRLGGRL